MFRWLLSLFKKRDDFALTLIDDPKEPRPLYRPLAPVDKSE